MIGLNALFWMLVILFAIIGMLRGWAKEILVTFAIVLTLFIVTLTERYVPFVYNVEDPATQFWIRFVLMITLAFFGYQTPNLTKLASTNRFAREKLQDSLLGLFLGALNGYLVVGTLMFYLDFYKYPLDFIVKPTGPIATAMNHLIPLMPPTWLGAPTIYFAIAIAFAFVLVVFI